MCYRYTPYQVQNRYVTPAQTITSMVVMERDLMMRFSPPTEITPEPVAVQVMGYDATCLPPPIATVPMPMPSPTPAQNEDESRMLVNIPPMLGEFTLLETSTQPSQSTITFLDVDTTHDDATLDACTDAPDDCSLRGAITQARHNPTQSYAIWIPNGTYRLTQTIIIEGKVSLIGLEAYTGSQFAGAVITQDGTVSNTLITIRNINSNQKSVVYLYNLNIRGGRGYSSAILNIHGSDVYVYDSRFEDNRANGYGGAIKVNDLFAPTSFVEIKNTVFEDNQAYMGGAILGEQGIGSIRLVCVTFKNNHAGLGGAIATYYSYAPFQFNGTISIDNSNFITNTSSNGGAIHRQGGTITIGNNHWSPDPSATSTAPNSVVGMPAPLPNGFGEFPPDCEVPPPPRKIQPICVVATSDNDNDGRGGTYNYARMRSGPGTSYGEINIVFNYDKILNFAIRGVHINSLYEVWFFGDYTGHYLNGTNLIFGTVQGWLRQDLLYTFSDCYYAQYVNEEGELSELPDANYDYDLLIPPPDSWLDVDCKPYITENEFPNEAEREVEENKNRQNCSKIVFYIYYKVFEKIYGRVPRISDLLATSYQNELRTIVDSGLMGINSRYGDMGFEIARDALAGHYWSVIDTYCDETGICEDRISNIEHLVTNYPQNLNGGYLWTLQAWYGKALRMRREFEELRYLEKIIFSDLNGTAIKDYIPTHFSQLVGRRALSDEGKSAPTIQWANYGYLTDEYISLRHSRPSHVVFCMFNLYLGGSYPNGAEDIFIVTTERSYGQSSTFNPANGYPDWAVSDAYSAYRTRNFANTTLLQCSCSNRLCERSN